MSSSDSEDDCYGNMAQKLKKIKSTFTKEKVNSTLQRSCSEDIAETSGSLSTNLISASETVTEDLNTTVNSTDNEEFTLDAIIARNSKAIPKGRGTKRKAASEAPVPAERVTRASRRRTLNSTRGRTSPAPETRTAPVDQTILPLSVTDPVQEIDTTAAAAPRRRGGARGRGPGSRARARGRGRGRSRGYLWAMFDDIFGSQINNNRSRSSRARNSSNNYPTYNVGNTDEYPDQSDNQQLFASKPATDDIEIIEEDPLDEDNEEMSVKVYWRSLDIFKFKIRKYQKLTQIFEYFMEKEGVSNDKILLTYNDRILKSDDTPDSINYSIAKFIDGGIVNQNITHLMQDDNKEEEKGGLKIKFQCQNKKKPFETTLRPDEKLALAMMKCAEHLETSIELLKFYFDGDLITSKSTPQELELEGGECIDVKIASS